MEDKTVLATKSLEFLINSFPADDEIHKEMRDSFVASVGHLKTLSEVLKNEEKKAFDGAKEKNVVIDNIDPELCPCKSKECVEAYEVELSLVKKKQIVKEALIAKKQLEDSLSELDSQLAVLQPLVEAESKED